MIRLGNMQDISQIETLVEEAKKLMKKFNNNQWDDKYPVTEHFEEDINTETLYVLEKMTGFMALSWSTNNNQKWYDELEWPIVVKAPMSFIDLLDHNSIKEQLQSYLISQVKLAEEHNIHVLFQLILLL